MIFQILNHISYPAIVMPSFGNLKNFASLSAIITLNYLHTQTSPARHLHPTLSVTHQSFTNDSNSRRHLFVLRCISFEPAFFASRFTG